MPRYLLVLENGLPADPAVFRVQSRAWNEGDIFVAGNGTPFRILDIDDSPDIEEPAASDFDAKWTVEPLPE